MVAVNLPFVAVLVISVIIPSTSLSFKAGTLTLTVFPIYIESTLVSSILKVEDKTILNRHILHDNMPSYVKRN